MAKTPLPGLSHYTFIIPLRNSTGLNTEAREAKPSGTQRQPLTRQEACLHRFPATLEGYQVPLD